MICWKRSLLDLAGSIPEFFLEGIGKRTQAIVAHMPRRFLYCGFLVPNQFMGSFQSFVLKVFEYRYAKKFSGIVGNSFYSIFDKEWSKVIKRRDTRRNLNYVTSTKKKAYGGKFS